MEVDWEHTAEAPEHKGSELLQHFPFICFSTKTDVMDVWLSLA